MRRVAPPPRGEWQLHAPAPPRTGARIGAPGAQFRRPRLAFVCSPHGSAACWPDAGRLEPRLWPRTPAVSSGPSLAHVARPSSSWVPVRASPDAPPTPVVLQIPAAGRPASPRGLTIPLRPCTSPGDRLLRYHRSSVPEPAPEPAPEPLVAQLSKAPLASRLIHNHPDVDGSSTNHCDTTPHTRSARARRIAAHVGRMPVR